MTRLEVELDITHTWDSDLSATLIAPDGTRVQLFANVGGGGQNFTGTIFDDQATMAIGDGQAPFSGRYRPVGQFSNVDGINAQGTWTLEVTDGVQWDTGTLNGWSLLVGADVQGVPPSLRIDNQYGNRSRPGKQ